MTVTGKLIAFGKSHLNVIIGCAAVVIISLIVVSIVSQVSRRNENKASARVEEALAKYAAILEEKDAKQAYEQVKK